MLILAAVVFDVVVDLVVADDAVSILLAGFYN